LSRTEQRSGLGRRLAIGIYSIALAYLVIVGFSSVIPQVFWPKRDDSFNIDCTDGLELLRDRIDELRLAYRAANETDPTELRRALASWDLRLNELAQRCDEDRVHLLNRYRYRVELSLERFMREDAPLAHRVSEALQSPTPEAPSQTSEPNR
jgi:hypothetical protein